MTNDGKNVAPFTMFQSGEDGFDYTGELMKLRHFVRANKKLAEVL